MKRILLLTIVLFLFIQINAIGQNAWINEIHYDNGGTDANEMIEVVIENPATYVLSDFSVTLYNGNDGSNYDTKTLDVFTVGATIGDFTFYYFYYPSNGIQNGSPDGMSLDYQGSVVEGQFLSYEGVMNATGGPANGLTSVDIGVEEGSTTLDSESLQLSGTGVQYNEFIWVDPATATAGELNNNQEFGTYVPDPEPTNYPTDFIAEANVLNIDITWADAIADQLPAGYLILASDEDNITAPVDGTPVLDDPVLSDGTAALNIDFGVETCSFLNLLASTTYYFEIYPYSNYGEFIDYKTDGTAPAADATTAGITIINSENFEDGLGTWTQYSVTGDQIWYQDSYGGENYAKMTGYDGGSNVNEDWLISPSLNLDLYDDEIFTFISAMNYSGNVLEVLYSDNYDGVSDPNAAVWILLEAELSAGSWAWTASGDVDLSGIIGANIYLAYKYTSSDSESSTWEIDNILITGLPDVGIDNPISNNGEINIYPNPAFDEVNISMQKEDVYKLEVYSVNGELVRSALVDGSIFKTDISDLTKGIYFVRISSINSKNVSIKKLIIL
ncbi:MAG: T9SS type A sorting domain-containing protein [Bacteroidales bacterium]|nr:T9SS type A sorting domain-containing protein [Bacteroidales bacterium]